MLSLSTNDFEIIKTCRDEKETNALAHEARGAEAFLLTESVHF